MSVFDAAIRAAALMLWCSARCSFIIVPTQIEVIFVAELLGILEAGWLGDFPAVGVWTRQICIVSGSRIDAVREHSETQRIVIRKRRFRFTLQASKRVSKRWNTAMVGGEDLAERHEQADLKGLVCISRGTKY